MGSDNNYYFDGNDYMRLGLDFDSRYAKELGPFFSKPGNLAPIDAKVNELLQSIPEYKVKAAKDPSFAGTMALCSIDGLRSGARDEYISRLLKNHSNPSTVFRQVTHSLYVIQQDIIRLKRLKVAGGPFLGKFQLILDVTHGNGTMGDVYLEALRWMDSTPEQQELLQKQYEHDCNRQSFISSLDACVEGLQGFCTSIADLSSRLSKDRVAIEEEVEILKRNNALFKARANK